MWAVLSLVLVVGLFFILFVLPQRRQVQAVNAMQSRLAVGDEIITTSGVYGRIVRLDDEDADVEVAPNTTIRLVRRAIGRRLADLPAPSQETDH
jgi:preprotein translocase subunit YajC